MSTATITVPAFACPALRPIARQLLTAAVRPAQALLFAATVYLIAALPAFL